MRNITWTYGELQILNCRGGICRLVQVLANASGWWKRTGAHFTKHGRWLSGIQVMVCVFILVGICGCLHMQRTVAIRYPFGLGIENKTGQRMLWVEVRLPNGRIYHYRGIETGFVESPIAIVGKTTIHIRAMCENGRVRDYSLVVAPPIIHDIMVVLYKGKAKERGFAPAGSADGWETAMLWNGSDSGVHYDIATSEGVSCSGDVSPGRRDTVGAGYIYGFKHGAFDVVLHFADGKTVQRHLVVNLDRDEPVYMIVNRDRTVHLWRKNESVPSGLWSRAYMMTSKQVTGLDLTGR